MKRIILLLGLSLAFFSCAAGPASNWRFSLQQPQPSETSKLSSETLSSSDDFILAIGPTITGFTPKSGTMGSQITLTGTNFNTKISLNTVKINGIKAAITYASATVLKVIVPEGATTGKISLKIGVTTTTATDDFTVMDFENTFVVRGIYVLFERRGWASGYWSGDAINQFNDYDSVVGSTVAQEIALQLDEMKKIGVNTIAFELRSSDSYFKPGPFLPPECNLGPALGLQYPSPTQTEIDNLVAFFNLASSKQMKILLRLVNTHMEEQPPVNNATWLNAILNAIKNHPALELVVFEGNTHLVDNNGDGIGDACGSPAEAPLWLGPSSKPAKYVKWAIQYAMSLGMPANKLTSEAVVGNYYADLELPAGPDATDGHLWKTVKVLKQILDELSIPENQRTYGISFYEHRKCDPTNIIACIDANPHTWADETLKQIFEIIGRKGSRVIAIEMGLSQADPNWTTAQAFESLVLLMKRYGVSGGCFWQWVFSQNNEIADPTRPTPVKIRGIPFSYNPVKDKIAKYYLESDIAVTKDSDNLAPSQGTEFNFTVSAKNNGPVDATGLKITDKLPTGLTYVSSTPSQGTYDSGTGVWDIGSLARAATATLTLKASADGLNAVTNTASVSALNDSDPESSNDSASATVTITSEYSLTTVANSAAGGTVTPAGTNYYVKDQNVQVQAASKPLYVFTGWSRDLTGTTNPTTVAMSGPKSITANFIIGKTLNAPTLVDPANNATGQPSSVTLKWQDTNSSPQELHYKVRIKPAGGAYKNYTLAANTTSFMKSGLTPGKLYYWNVQAVGTGTTTKNSLWANGGVDFKFTVQPPATLNAPTLASPADGAIDQPLSLSLNWLDTNSSPQELHYKVRFKVAGGAYSNTTLAAGASSYAKSGLARGKTYYWSVQAIGNGTTIKNSAWPADYRFTTIK
jgi:uncharacterized repeat protein (TIGR01451 family)/uncharacterized repeat protein (TIGR02543 family)